MLFPYYVSKIRPSKLDMFINKIKTVCISLETANRFFKIAAKMTVSLAVAFLASKYKNQYL